MYPKYAFILVCNNNLPPLGVLLVGGGQDVNVDINPFQSPPCQVPNLKTGNALSRLVLTPDNVLLDCGGRNRNYAKSCRYLDVAEGGGWTHHSDLTNKRAGGVVGVTLPSGTYLFGGRYSSTTMDFLPVSTSTWQAGPVIPGRGIEKGCGVAVSDTEIVLIPGGKSVIKYSSLNNQWTSMADLAVGRTYHACTLHNGQIIVSGGVEEGKNGITRSTVVIPLSDGIPRT